MTSRANDHLGRVAHVDHGEDVALPAVADQLRGQLLRSAEVCVPGIGLIVHREGIVDHQHLVAWRGAATGQELFAVWFGHGQHDQHDDERAHGEQQPLLQLQPAGVFSHRGEQKLHRGPGRFAKAVPAPQMNQQRRGSGAKPTKHREVAEAEGQ